MSMTFVSPNVWPIYENWLLIGKGASRLVALKNSAGLTVKPSTRSLRVSELTATSKNIRPGHRAIAKRLARRGHRLFLLTGKSPVELAYVYAYNGKRKVAKLEVRVAKVIEVPVAFHVLRHMPGGKGGLVVASKKWTSEEDLTDALQVAHQIYRQAGIALDMHSRNYADVRDDLSIVDVKSESSPGYVALRPHGRKSVINVFVVGKVLNNHKTDGTTFGHDCIVDTTAPSLKEFGRLIAHELGHAFGIHTHSPDAFKGSIRKEVKGNVVRYVGKKTRYLMAANLTESEGFDAGITRNQTWDMREGAKAVK